MKRWWAVLTAAVFLLHVGHMVSPAYSAINPMERERNQHQQLEHSYPGDLQEHEFASPSSAASSSSQKNEEDQSSSLSDVGDSAVESAAAKRYMRFGRNYLQQQQQQHVAVAASGDAEKRYMRFGRREHTEQRLPMTSEVDADPDMVDSAGAGLNWVNVANKRYMRFGRR